MREIKFRAWHMGGAMDKYKGQDVRVPGMIFDAKPGDCLVWKNNGQEITHIMQYIGLTYFPYGKK